MEANLLRVMQHKDSVHNGGGGLEANLLRGMRHKDSPQEVLLSSEYDESGPTIVARLITQAERTPEKNKKQTYVYIRDIPTMRISL